MLIMIVLLAGCGHNVGHTDRGVGFIFRVPMPDGGSLVELKIGKIDSTTTVLRGNSTYDSVASSGGSLTGIGGVSERIQMKTNPQLNEGYLENVLISGNVDPITKQILAVSLVKGNAPESQNARAVSIGGGAGTGENLESLVPKVVGIDNLVDKAAETAPKVVGPIMDGTVKSIGHVSTTAKTVSNDASDVVKFVSSMTALIVITLTLVITGIVLIVRAKHKKKEETPKENPPDNII